MKNMAKAYTDINQSKMLAKILPLDSADMRYGYIAPYDYSDRMYDGGYDKIPYPKELSNKIQLVEEYASELPCWSLDALLNVLPKPTKRVYELNIYGGDEKPFFGFNDCDMNIHKGFEGDNYVDACVNMIVYMHEKLNDF